jgi:hypothetical protein
MINITNSAQRWRNAPVYLTPEAAINPYLVLEWFFYPSSPLPKYRKWMERWVIAAIEKKNKWNRNKLIRCIHRFQEIAALLDALWIIYERGDRISKEQTGLRGGIDQPYHRWSEKMQEVMERDKYEEAVFQLEKITVEEELDPFRVIEQFFKNKDSYDAKQKLDFWCHTAIANSWEYQTMDKAELFDFYEQVLRLLEAVFVIVEVRFLVAEDRRL